MKPNDISQADHQLKTMQLRDNLLKECRVMASFAITRGKSVDAAHIAPLHKDDSEIKGSELLPVYNYLVNLVKPATPGTLVLFEKNRQSTNRFKFLGPLPIVRQFMLLTIFSLLALILTSLSSDVNTHTIQLSLLQGNGIDQALRLTFLLACASVGASFYALFKMNSYINQGTFDMKYAATYWSRFVLGLVAGVLLSELFVVFINSAESTQQITSNQGLNENVVLDSANYLLKPILAILGGFSASLVYRILNRLIEAIESIFKGSSSEVVRQMQQKMAMEGQENEHRVKSMATQQILTLKSDLMAEGASTETLDKIDDTIGVLMNTKPLNEASVNLSLGEVTDLMRDKAEPLIAPITDQLEANTVKSAEPAEKGMPG
ncbi:MAG: hypothetical protein Roseis2KO_13240 [Roseivirga sp.]